jgi:hypothetical protein
MAAQRASWLDKVSEYITTYPALSAAIAFELGMLAARATRTVRLEQSASKLAEFMPSALSGLAGYAPSSKGKRNGTPANGHGRKSARRPAAKKKAQIKVA